MRTEALTEPFSYNPTNLYVDAEPPRPTRVCALAPSFGPARARGCFFVLFCFLFEAEDAEEVGCSLTSHDGLVNVSRRHHRRFVATSATGSGVGHDRATLRTEWRSWAAAAASRHLARYATFARTRVARMSELGDPFLTLERRAHVESHRPSTPVADDPRSYNELMDQFSLHHFMIRKGVVQHTTPEFISFKRKVCHRPVHRKAWVCLRARP